MEIQEAKLENGNEKSKHTRPIFQFLFSNPCQSPTPAFVA